MAKVGAFAIIDEKEQMKSVCHGEGRSKSSSEKQFAQMSIHV